VKVTRDERGLTKDFILESNYPRFGNNNNDVDKLAIDITKLINKMISGRSYYRNAKPKIGINSYGMNIVFGKNTGSTPDGRFKGSSYSIGINPISNIGADNLISALNSILKVPSNLCANGITTTLNIIPSALSSNNSLEKIMKLLDEFFNKNGSHLEINIIDQNRLLEAYNNSNKYQSLVLRNSGCLILYNNLTFEQKDDLMDRTFYKNV
jgi:formate C-acetyltransferase